MRKHHGSRSIRRYFRTGIRQESRPGSLEDSRGPDTCSEIEIDKRIGPGRENLGVDPAVGVLAVENLVAPHAMHQIEPPAPGPLELVYERELLGPLG